MLKIGICDDSEADAAKIQGLLQQFTKSHPKLPIQARVFRSGYDLLDFIAEHGGFDLYLLDILMPRMTGMDLAKRIRQRMEKAAILFLTTSQEYAVEAFGVEASGYLMKPVQQADFDHAVISCVKNLAPEENPSLVLKTKDGVRRVPVCELMTVESVRHSYRCTLADGATVEATGAISSLFEELRAYSRFYMPHRAFIVNFDYVNGLASFEILMAGGKRIPVSRNTYTDLKNTYMNYILGRNRRV